MSWWRLLHNTATMADNERSQTARVGKLGQNFRVDERVRMARTTDPELDGYCGTILGTSADDKVCAFYIIELDAPHSLGYRAITLIESCIDRISNYD